MNGKLIVIEGLDGSGKATQTKLLYDALTAREDRVLTLSFPCYDDESSALVRMYLGGELGERPDDVNGYAASVFYAVDRFASYKKSWHAQYAAGYTFIVDRYTTSNAVYQAGKLRPEQWDKYLDWLFDFEYNLMGIPKPDAVIFLDVSAETSEMLMRQRYTGDDSKRDIHEKDIAFQRTSREAALYCAKREDWHIVRCDGHGGMRKIQEIAQDILRIAEEVINNLC